MSRKRSRLDANHHAIVQAFRSLGYCVQSTASLGGGFPDLVVQRHGYTELVEVKSPKGDYTPDQERFTVLGWKVRTVRRVEDVLDFVTLREVD